MIKYFFFLLLFYSQVLEVYAQDESWYRNILKKKSTSNETDLFRIEKDQIKDPYEVKTAKYKFDLNQDGQYEFLEVVKNQLKDWVYLYDDKKELINKFKLEPRGVESYLYKIRLTKLDPKTIILVLFYYEGLVEYLDFDARSKLYYMVIEDNNFKQIYFKDGPYIFHEQKLRRDHYHLRDYKVNIIDLNNDGMKEISVKYGKISRVSFYRGRGEWAEL